MNHLSYRFSIIAVFLIINFVKQVNGQQDSLFDLTGNNLQFDYDQIQGLPVTHVNDIFELNPRMFNSSKSGTYYTDGIGMSDDYTWIDGVPIRFAEEMPLKLIGSARFNSFEDYFEHGNSYSGTCSFIPVSTPDSFSLMVDNNATLVHKLFTDSDLQLILSGPIRFNKSAGKGGTSVSYHLASRLFALADAYPSYIARNFASDEYLDYLAENPLRPSAEPGGTYANALYTGASNSVGSYFNPNATKLGYSVYGNIQAGLKNGMRIKIGTYTVSKTETIPIYENYFFNQDGNPEKTTFYSNNYLRLDQQLDLSESVRFHYQVQGQYSYYHSITQDPNFGKDYFSYGYAGKFETYKRPTFEIGSDSVNGNFYDQAWLLNSWDYDTLVEFTPGNLNPGLSAYTSSYYSIYKDDPLYHFQNLEQVQLGGGLLNGQMPDGVYGLYNNEGTAYNEYSEQDQRQIKIFASGDLVVGKHKINLGFQFTRDAYSAYQIAPVRLWTLMRGLTNFHLYELDIDHPYVHEGDLMDTIYYPRKYDAESQRAFDKKLREALGLDPEGLDFIDIDSYDYNTNSISYFDKDGVKQTVHCGQELFSLDMFNADELMNDGISPFVTYAGYDYLGNRIRNKVSFNDFFTAKNNQGEYLRQISAYTPMNYSAYASYQVDLKGWAINAGFRIDAFNTNQQVLKDPYLLYEAYTVEDLAANAGFSYAVPSGIGNDFVVYVDNVNNPQQVVGYRDGDHWYDREGDAIINLTILDAGSGICPYIINPEQEYITTDVFTRNKIYFNFLPQVNIQKKLKNWLILSLRYNSGVQNPNPEVTFSNPAAFYFCNNVSYLPNGSLKPSRTDKIRAGFSVLPFPGFIISAEGYMDYINDLIYFVNRCGAYPKDYESYENIDNPIIQYGADIGITHKSGETSGFNYGITYHLFLKNKASKYMFHFTAPRNLLKGYLQFNTGYGNDYIGPSGSGNYSLFNGIGLGVYGHFHSVIQYLATDNSIHFDIKTMPAQAYLDLKIEKGFHFKNDRYMLNLYCVIHNLFNSKMIYKVYSTTGKPDDDGYLTDPESQKQISEALCEDSYRFLYSSYINNPDNYGLPRRTTIGVSFSL